MPLTTLFRRNVKENAMTETTATTDATPTDDVLMRFLTQGGATVELRNLQYRTRLDGRGYWTEKWWDVSGTNWTCLGCGVTGRGGTTGGEAGYSITESGRARDEANGHAETCRAMPRPTA